MAQGWTFQSRANLPIADGARVCDPRQLCRHRSLPESQRDSVLKPRIAPAALPWVTVAQGTQPQRGCGQSSHRRHPSHNPVGVEQIIHDLPMNRSAEHRLGSMDAIARQLAGTVPGAPIARFMVGEQVQRNTGLPRVGGAPTLGFGPQSLWDCQSGGESLTATNRNSDYLSKTHPCKEF